MKVKDLITPTIIKRINLVLFPVLAAIFILAGIFIYQIRSEQAIRLGKLQARITSLNMLEFVKNEMLNYINVCVSYAGMVEMYNEVEPVQQASYLSQLTQHILQTNTNVLALRCYFDSNTEAYHLKQSQKAIAHEVQAGLPHILREMEIVQSSAGDKVVADIERQFYKLGLLDKTSLAKSNNVSITAPYEVQSVSAQRQARAYNIITFYKTIRDANNDIIGHACVDVEAAKIAQLLQQLQALATKQNCEVSLYLNEDNKFVGLRQEANSSPIEREGPRPAPPTGGELSAFTGEELSIDLNSQPENMSDELISIINDGYDAEYDDTRNSQYLFIIPTRLPNFVSNLTIIASFSHGELTKSISGFTANLLIIMAVAYILIVLLLFYVNKYLYKKFIEAEIIITNSE